MTELGNRLKEARLAKGMSLDDLQTATKIQKRYLQGIEEGNYSMMPGPFYVRAFIKQYAEAVEIEPEELFEEYKAEIPKTFNEDIPEKLSRVQTKKNISGGNSSKLFDILPKILVVAFIIGALAISWYFISKNAGDETNEPVDQNNEETTYEQSENLSREAVDEKEPETEENPTDVDDNTEATEPDEEEEEEVVVSQNLSVVESKGRNTIFELKDTEKFELKIVSTGETWVNIKNGKGYSFFQGMLVQGDTDSHTVDLTNETEAVIIVGNSTNTEIYINDQKLEYATPPAEQVRQDITIRYTQQPSQ